MAKFQSQSPFKTIAVPGTRTVIEFKDGYYATTKKIEIEAIKKAKGTREIEEPTKAI